MTITDYSDFYHETFLPVYADLVAMIADKPQQIIFEIENSFSHLMVYHSTSSNVTTNTKDENLNKAFNHLVRATIDCYKILWTEISDFLDNIMKNDVHRTFAFNEDETYILSIWKNFKEKARNARQKEMSNIGIDYTETIFLYKEAIDEGMKLLDNFDFEKFKKVKTFNISNLIKQNFIGFILGIIASIIASYIISLNIY